MYNLKTENQTRKEHKKGKKSKIYPWPMLNTKDMQTKQYHSVSVRSSGESAAEGLFV